MDQDILKIIEKQKQEKAFRFVLDTENRLLSLDYTPAQVDAYLVWAYQQAMDQDRLNLDRYRYYMNRLPLQEPEVKDQPEATKVTLDEMVEWFKQLMNQGANSLASRSIRYLLCQLVFDDDYRLMVKVFDDVKVEDFALLIAQREKLLGDQKVKVDLLQDQRPVDTKMMMTDPVLGDLLEEKGDELLISFPHMDKHVRLIYISDEVLHFDAMTEAISEA